MLDLALNSRSQDSQKYITRPNRWRCQRGKLYLPAKCTDILDREASTGLIFVLVIDSNPNLPL